MSTSELKYVVTQCVLAGFIISYAPCSSAHSTTTTASASTPNQAVTASASLDFDLTLNKFLYFQVGSAGTTQDTLIFNTLPTNPTGLVSGTNNGSTSWNGTVPTFTNASNAVAVALKTNGGQVNIKATVVGTLSNGSQTLPYSNLTISSSDTTNFPAPVIPNAGTGAAVTVTGTAYANLVTDRTATWTFNYATPTSAVPGTYQGQVTFTASTP